MLKRMSRELYAAIWIALCFACFVIAGYGYGGTWEYNDWRGNFETSEPLKIPEKYLLLKYRVEKTRDIHAKNIVANTSESKAQECTPVKKFLYVKTHKTGSSTVQDIINKHSKRWKVRVAPAAYPKPFHGGYPGYYRKDLMSKYLRNDSDYKPNVIQGHQRFNKKEIVSMLPKEAKYITVIRNPVRQFESAFHYYYGKYRYHARKFDKVVCFGEPYLQVAGKLKVNISDYIEMAKHKLNNKMAWSFRSLNYQAFDLGMDPQEMDEAKIHDYILELDSTFDLVMIMDYFLESLLLMKETMCMDMEDLVVLPQMTGHYQRHSFTEEEANTIRSMNKQDVMLYEHFNKTFWKKVASYGEERMKKDVETLRMLINDRSKINKHKSHHHDDSKRVKVVESESKKRRKRDIKNPDFIPSSDREGHIARVKSRILSECGHSRFCTENSAQILAEYMVDNNGWCPH